MSVQTYEQILTLHRKLKRQYGKLPGLISIGFGCASKELTPDPQRGLTACFYVRKKKKRVPQAEKIQSVVVLERKTKSLPKGFSVPTDVVECPETYISGRNVLVNGGGALETASVGLLLKWREGTTAKFGFLTVGHVFRAVQPGHVVDLANAGGQFRVFGRLIAKSASGSKNDLGLVEVFEQTLSEFAPTAISGQLGILTANDVVSKLAASLGAGSFPGTILGSTGPSSIKVGIIHPEFLIDQLGIVKAVLDGSSAVSSTFGPGTSGSLWMVGNELACIQTAGFGDSGFSKGLGQLVFARLNWVQKVLSPRTGFLSSSLELSAAY